MNEDFVLHEKFYNFFDKFKDKFSIMERIDVDYVGYSYKIKSEEFTKNLRIFYIDIVFDGPNVFKAYLQYFSYETYSFVPITNALYYKTEELNDDLFIKYLDKFEKYRLLE